MKIQVTAVKRPFIFSSVGSMDYMLNRACVLEVTSKSNTGYYVTCAKNPDKTWFIPFKHAEVVTEQSEMQETTDYAFPDLLRKGQQIDWNQIDPEVSAMYLAEHAVPTLCKYDQGKWYVKYRADMPWTEYMLTDAKGTEVELVFRGNRQVAPRPVGWYHNPAAVHEPEKYVFKHESDHWIFVGDAMHYSDRDLAFDSNTFIKL